MINAEPHALFDHGTHVHLLGMRLYSPRRLARLCEAREPVDSPRSKDQHKEGGSCPPFFLCPHS